MTPLWRALKRRLRLAWLSARYGVRLRPCPIVPGSYVITSHRRLRSAQVEEVKRLHLAMTRGEKRSNGTRGAGA